MGIRVNIDLDVDSIFDEEFNESISHSLKRIVEEKLNEHMTNTVIQLIHDNAKELDEAALSSYKEKHAAIMEQYEA